MRPFSRSQRDYEGAAIEKGEDGAETEEWEVEEMRDEPGDPVRER